MRDVDLRVDLVGHFAHVALSGLRAGAGIVAGVLTGDSARAELEAVPSQTGLPGSPLILDSIADLLPYLNLG